MNSISKTSAFAHHVPAGPHASPASLGARCRKRAGGVATSARLVQRHVGGQPEAPTACWVRWQPASLTGANHRVNTYILSAEKESEHKPQAAASAAQGQHAALNSAFVPALLFIPEAPSAPLLQTKSSWLPQTKPPSSLAEPSRAVPSPCPGREGGHPISRAAAVAHGMLVAIKTDRVQPAAFVAQPREELGSTFSPLVPPCPPLCCCGGGLPSQAG